jgi:hypothetical protein
VNGRGRTARVHDPRPLGTTIRSCALRTLRAANDLGLLFLVDLAISRLEPIPRKLGFATRAADGEDAAWIRRRIADACAASGTAG